jgi:nitroimidazol reductase NimA-like FMN-containing flavoprotein (pyridoxamine 5'-phosphate oxidase superfamily)
MAEHAPDMSVKADCLMLLRRVRVGRLVFTARDLPAVRPVYFSVDGDDIVVRTAARSGLADEVTGSVVALQADQGDHDGRGAWSVTVTGRAAAQDDPEERRRLLESASLPAQRADDVLVVVSPELFDLREWTL